LYRAVDGTGQTIDFLLSAKRDKKAAQRFFKRALGREHTRNPREVVTDRLTSYPGLYHVGANSRYVSPLGFWCLGRFVGVSWQRNVAPEG
jgi:transposase-like protein